MTEDTNTKSTADEEGDGDVDEWVESSPDADARAEAHHGPKDADGRSVEDDLERGSRESSDGSPRPESDPVTARGPTTPTSKRADKTRNEAIPAATSSDDEPSSGTDSERHRSSEEPGATVRPKSTRANDSSADRADDGGQSPRPNDDDESDTKRPRSSANGTLSGSSPTDPATGETPPETRRSLTSPSTGDQTRESDSTGGDTTPRSGDESTDRASPNTSDTRGPASDTAEATGSAEPSAGDGTADPFDPTGKSDAGGTGLFDDLLGEEAIFENKEVLRPAYTPHELPHRGDQINEMASILVSVLRGETPSNILIYGKTGTGKTASAKFVSQELERTSEKYEVPCHVEYINCEQTDTQYRVLARLANTFTEENRGAIDERLATLESLRDAVAESEPVVEDPAAGTDTAGHTPPETRGVIDGGGSDFNSGDSPVEAGESPPETRGVVDRPRSGESGANVAPADTDTGGTPGSVEGPGQGDTRTVEGGSMERDEIGDGTPAADGFTDEDGGENRTRTDVGPAGTPTVDRPNESESNPRGRRGPLAGTEFNDLEAVERRIESLEDDRSDMTDVPMTGWPTDRVYNEFFDAVDYAERVVVIMLDEIDKLVEKSGDDTLYNLSRMNADLENSRVSIIGISNDLKFTDFLDPRVKSSLGEEEIVFPPYDANQLKDILQHRAGVAFRGDVLSPDVIPLCAAFAAQEHGDARRALDLLRTAGELAERAGADRVEEAHVRRAQDKIELDRVIEVVRTLPTQSKIVLHGIIQLERDGTATINTGEVYNAYRQLCERIDVDVLTQRRVTDLISELDMLGIVNAVVVSKGRYGRTKEISLSVPREETEAVLLADSRLEDLEGVSPTVQSRFDA